MALKPFWNKKLHLGYTKDEIRTAFEKANAIVPLYEHLIRVQCTVGSKVNNIDFVLINTKKDKYLAQIPLAADLKKAGYDSGTTRLAFAFSGIPYENNSNLDMPLFLGIFSSNGSTLNLSYRVLNFTGFSSYDDTASSVVFYSDNVKPLNY